MSINATADGVIYSGIDTINAGGKNITLSEEYTGTKQITSNGTHDVSGYKNAEVNVNGAAKLQPLTATANDTYFPDTDYDGFSSVLVNVPGLATNWIKESQVISIKPDADTNDDLTLNFDQISGVVDTVIMIQSLAKNTDVMRTICSEFSHLTQSGYPISFGSCVQTANEIKNSNPSFSFGENNVVTITHAVYGGTKCYLRVGYTYEYVGLRTRD